MAGAGAGVPAGTPTGRRSQIVHEPHGAGGWRAYMGARIAELRVEQERVRADIGREPEPGMAFRLRAIEDCLARAEEFVGLRTGARWWRRDRAVEGASLNVAAADVLLVEVHDAVRISARVPEILATVQASLPAADPRRGAVEEIDRRSRAEMSEHDRATLAAALRS